MKILFLDFDGVLNSADWIRRRPELPEGLPDPKDFNHDRWAQRNLDPDAIVRLSRIVDDTGCRVVISSSWRTMCPLTKLNGWLARFGGFTHTLLGATPCGWEEVDANPSAFITGPRLGTRGAEIAAWLALLPAGLGREYCIVDDDRISGHEGRFVQTNSSVGLTDERADLAIEILNRGDRQ